MKIRFVRTGKEAEVNESYAIRLMEQGKAVICPAEYVETAGQDDIPLGKQDAVPPVSEPEKELPAGTGKKTRKKSG